MKYIAVTLDFQTRYILLVDASVTGHSIKSTAPPCQYICAPSKYFVAFRTH